MGWNLKDLTLAASGAPQVGGEAIGYVFDAQNTQHVFSMLITIFTSSGGTSMGGIIMMTLRPRLAHRTLSTFRQPKRRTYLRTVLGAIGVALTLMLTGWEVGGVTIIHRHPTEKGKKVRSKHLTFARR